MTFICHEFNIKGFCSYGLPKEHYYDALSVGEDKSYKIITDKVLIIKAGGRGTRQMCRVDKYGFPRTTATQSEQAKLVRCNPIPFVEWISAKECN